jgi:hypothetical protein
LRNFIEMTGSGMNRIPHQTAEALLFYEPLYAVVLELRGQGLSLSAIGREFEKRGIRSRRGQVWAAARCDAFSVARRATVDVKR